MIITVDAVTKEPREYNGRKQWGVKLPNGEWISVECDFQPVKGMQFDVAIKESYKNGRSFKNATIIGPAPAPAAQPSVMADFNAVKAESMAMGQKPPQVQPAAQPAPSVAYSSPHASAKIPWWDWVHVIRMSWDVAIETGMPPAEAVALINTTLIAYSNGKLEAPPAPLTGEEQAPQDDDIPF